MSGGTGLSPVRAALHLSGRPWNRTHEPSAHCTGRDNALEWGEDAPALRWPVEGLELEQMEDRNYEATTDGAER